MDENEDDDEDEVRTLQPRVELHENDIGFMKFHTRGSGLEGSGFSPAAGLKSGQFDRRRKLNGINIQFSDRINQSSLKRFAPADRMDRINILNQKNPDNPVNPV
jgi:hypothetical protein